jgi:hypothetical protein
MNLYDRQIYQNTVQAEQSDIEKETDFMRKEDVRNMLDEIERRVDDIRDMLVKISGLSEIEDVKEKLNSLSNDLY